MESALAMTSSDGNAEICQRSVHQNSSETLRPSKHRRHHDVDIRKNDGNLSSTPSDTVSSTSDNSGSAREPWLRCIFREGNDGSVRSALSSTEMSSDSHGDHLERRESARMSGKKSRICMTGSGAGPNGQGFNPRRTHARTQGTHRPLPEKLIRFRNRSGLKKDGKRSKRSSTSVNLWPKEKNDNDDNNDNNDSDDKNTITNETGNDGYNRRNDNSLSGSRVQVLDLSGSAGPAKDTGRGVAVKYARRKLARNRVIRWNDEGRDEAAMIDTGISTALPQSHQALVTVNRALAHPALQRAPVDCDIVGMSGEAAIAEFPTHNDLLALRDILPRQYNTVVHLVKICKTLMKENKVMLSERSRLLKGNAKMKEEILKMLRMHNILVEGVKHYEKENEMLSSLASERKSECDEVTSNVEQLQRRNEELTFQAKQRQADSDEAMSQLQREQQSNEKLTLQAKQRQAEYQKVVLRTQRLQKKNEELTRQVKRGEADHDDASSRIQRLEKSNERVTCQAKEVRADCDEVMGQVKHLRDENNKLSLQTAQLQTENWDRACQAQELQRAIDELEACTPQVYNLKDNPQTQLQAARESSLPVPYECPTYPRPVTAATTISTPPATSDPHRPSFPLASTNDLPVTPAGGDRSSSNGDGADTGADEATARALDDEARACESAFYGHGMAVDVAASVQVSALAITASGSKASCDGELEEHVTPGGLLTSSSPSSVNASSPAISHRERSISFASSATSTEVGGVTQACESVMHCAHKEDGAGSRPTVKQEAGSTETFSGEGVEDKGACANALAVPREEFGTNVNALVRVDPSSVVLPDTDAKSKLRRSAASNSSSSFPSGSSEAVDCTGPMHQNEVFRFLRSLGELKTTNDLQSVPKLVDSAIDVIESSKAASRNNACIPLRAPVDTVSRTRVLTLLREVKTMKVITIVRVRTLAKRALSIIQRPATVSHHKGELVAGARPSSSRLVQRRVNTATPACHQPLDVRRRLFLRRINGGDRSRVCLSTPMLPRLVDRQGSGGQISERARSRGQVLALPPASQKDNTCSSTSSRAPGIANLAPNEEFVLVKGGGQRDGGSMGRPGVRFDRRVESTSVMPTAAEGVGSSIMSSAAKFRGTRKNKGARTSNALSQEHLHDMGGHRYNTY